VADAVVGIVANPLSGRDIRRLVAKASVFPTAEKANMVQRVITACAAVSVDRVLLNTDLGGISAAVLRALRTRRPSEPRWPYVEFLETERITQSAADTTEAVTRMRAAGARVVICLGGDGTARVAAAACGDTPLLALSTGTNNAFPRMREATVAGLAAGLLAIGAVEAGPPATRRAPVLEVTAAGRTEIALVDVAVSAAGHVGSRALWDPSALTELYCTFAEPDGIGLSSVAGLLCPSPRTEPDGVALRLGAPDGCPAVVRAPIAPGLVADVGVRDWRPFPSGTTHRIDAGRGVIAVDGEREIEFRTPAGAAPGERPYVRLRPDGPRCVDVPAVLAAAAARGLLTENGRKA
jgi:predicted polyphosphate/ATP-dependent NAD kinase